MTKKTVGLYIHFPFCAYKCGYCDFNSWVELKVDPQRSWFKGIQNEIAFWKNKGLNNFCVDTIFMGGGTPSLLKADVWNELVEHLKSEISFSGNCEWTVECNPETITEELLERFQRSGVNRLSLGIQSFQEKFLKRLERGATAERNKESLELIAKKWPHRWSFDLMFGLPQQTLQEWQEDLEESLRFGVKHISAYQLTLTTQKSKSWLQAPEEALLGFYRVTREVLDKNGLSPYEISNFAASGEECRHNLKYWRAEAFLGLGPGAYALVPNELLDSVKKEENKNYFGAHLKNPSRFDEWLKRSENLLSNEVLSSSAFEWRDAKIHATELLLVGLRLEKGIEKNLFPKEISLEKLSTLSHLIQITPTHLVATDRGREILDTTISEAVNRLFQND